LPPRSQLETPVCRVQDEGLGQTPRGGGEPDQRRQRLHRRLEIDVAARGKELLQSCTKARVRQLARAVQIAEPANGGIPRLFVDPVRGCCKRNRLCHRKRACVHGCHLGPLVRRIPLRPKDGA
jgi:hypothetical protein